jgi:hypothetical protein
VRVWALPSAVGRGGRTTVTGSSGSHRSRPCATSMRDFSTYAVRHQYLCFSGQCGAVLVAGQSSQQPPQQALRTRKWHGMAGGLWGAQHRQYPLHALKQKNHWIEPSHHRLLCTSLYAFATVKAAFMYAAPSQMVHPPAV